VGGNRVAQAGVRHSCQHPSEFGNDIIGELGQASESDTPVGPDLRRQGIPDNLVLSTRRAATVANFLVSQGVNPNIVSAKEVGDTRPGAPNDTPQGRAQNRRMEITVQGPGA
jgi:OmpA family